MKTFLFTVALVAIFAGCQEGKISSNEVWTSFIYPDKTNIKRSMEYNKFNSLSECKTASGLKLKELDLTARGFYECGLNCAYNDGMKTLICERVVKE